MVRNLVASIPTQVELNKGANPASVKLAVDPYLRVIGQEAACGLGPKTLKFGPGTHRHAMSLDRALRSGCVVVTRLR
jgi:hypothetical protein